jgi:ribosomal protein S18 acetylase RimI-like enzyme
MAFAPAEADALIAFCVAHGSPHDGALVGRMLRHLTSDPAGVLVWGDDGGRAVVATVLDRVVNGADAASLEILGARAPLAAKSVWELIAAPGVAFARGGPRRALDLTLYPWLIERPEDTEAVLRARGFVPAYTSYIMRRPPGAAAAPVPPLDDGWRWAPLEAGRVDEAHAAIGEMFAGAASLSLSPLPDFRRAVSTAPDVWRALLDGERLAGLVRVVAVGTGEGKVAMLGRMPRYRGRGLGARLLAEGLRLLAERGARDVELDVESANERALALYRRFGFEVVSRMPVLRISLRP